MFEISDDPQGFKRLRISGRIEAEEMRAGLEAFLDALVDGQRTPFLYTITDFEFPLQQTSLSQIKQNLDVLKNLIQRL